MSARYKTRCYHCGEVIRLYDKNIVRFHIAYNSHVRTFYYFHLGCLTLRNFEIILQSWLEFSKKVNGDG
jgi:hypothetical protein